MTDYYKNGWIPPEEVVKLQREEIKRLRDAVKPMIEDYELGVYNHDVLKAVKKALQEQ